MSTISKINNAIDELKPLFKAANEAHSLFRQHWDEHFPKEGQAYKNTELYNTDLARFRKTNDRVSAKINVVLDELRQGIVTNVNYAIAYVSVPDRHFGSGYMKQRLFRVFKRIELNKDQKEHLRNIRDSLELNMSGIEKKEYSRMINIF